MNENKIIQISDFYIAFFSSLLHYKRPITKQEINQFYTSNNFNEIFEIVRGSLTNVNDNNNQFYSLWLHQLSDKNEIITNPDIETILK